MSDDPLDQINRAAITTVALLVAFGALLLVLLACLCAALVTADARVARDGSFGLLTPTAPSAKLAEPPAGLLAALPPAPPGNVYVLLSGDILLIAAASRIVVDAVSANK